MSSDADMLDLESHLRAAVKIVSNLYGGPPLWNLDYNDHSTMMLKILSVGFANWVNQRDAQIASRLDLASWPAELLERATLLLGEAAIAAAKREAGK